jgi:hypothetical protein
MDQEWMYVGNRVSQRFIEGVKTFLRLLQNTRSYKTCLVFTINVAYALIAVMRKKLEI